MYQLLRRSRLSDDALTLVHRRILAGVLVTWLPLLLLSAWEGRAWGGDIRIPFLLNAEDTRAVSRRAAAPRPGGARRPRAHAAGRGAVPRARPDCRRRTGPASMRSSHRRCVCGIRWPPSSCSSFSSTDSASCRATTSPSTRAHGPRTAAEAAPDSPTCRSRAGGTRWSACPSSSSCSSAGISACSSGPASSGRCHASSCSSSRRIPTVPEGWDSSPMSSTRSRRCSSRTGFCSPA